MATGWAGRWVFLGGEAGVGKTSLVAALLAQLDAPPGGPVVRRGFCDHVATPPPLGAVLDAVPELAHVLEGTTPATRPRLFHDIRTLLTTGPTVLVLEDVHWADGATLELLVPRPPHRRPAAAGRRDLSRRRGRRRPTRCTGAGRARDRARRSADRAATAHAPGGRGSRVRRRLGGRPERAARRDRRQPVLRHRGARRRAAGVPATVRDAVLARDGRHFGRGARRAGGGRRPRPGARSPRSPPCRARDADGVDECVADGVLVWDGSGVHVPSRARPARRRARLAPGVRAELHAPRPRRLVKADDRPARAPRRGRRRRRRRGRGTRRRPPRSRRAARRAPRGGRAVPLALRCADDLDEASASRLLRGALLRVLPDRPARGPRSRPGCRR